MITDTTMQIELLSFIDSIKPVYGYHDNNNDGWTMDELAALAAGEQVHKGGKYSEAFYFTTPYNNAVRLVYAVSVSNGSDAPTPGTDAKYRGFMFAGNIYTDSTRIAEQYCKDVNNALLDILPHEPAAKRNYKNHDEYMNNQVETWKNYDYEQDAKRHFYNGTRPELCLYHNNNKSVSLKSIIAYIQDPAAEIERAANEYKDSHAAEIYIEYIRFNGTRKALEAIKSDPTREEHKILKMTNCIDNQKTVRVLLDNGNEVKVEASSVKYIGLRSDISYLYVSAADRDKLHKNEYGRPEDITVNQIKEIIYNGKTLYKA
jgi:hypothetical protein